MQLRHKNARTFAKSELSFLVLLNRIKSIPLLFQGTEKGLLGADGSQLRTVESKKYATPRGDARDVHLPDVWTSSQTPLPGTLCRRPRLSSTVPICPGLLRQPKLERAAAADGGTAVDTQERGSINVFREDRLYDCVLGSATTCGTVALLWSGRY